MPKKWFILILIMTLAVLAACNKAEDKNNGDDEVPEIIDVKLEVPESVDVNGKVELKATVTQGDEQVKDADDVNFEIWEEGKKEESQKIPSKNNKDGTYTAETTFEHDGLFNVQVHVTARGMHSMPKKQVTVGQGSAHGEEHGDEHGHAEGFSMHFMEPETVAAGKEADLVVHVQLDNHPLEKAKVRYEIWKHDSDKRDWVDATESKPGEYAGVYTFKGSSEYTVKIHVENDEGLHEHEEHHITVK